MSQELDTKPFDDAADQAMTEIEETAEREVVEIDGELVYADTGEYAGPIPGSGWLPEQLTTLDDVEQFMEKLLEAESLAFAEEVRLNAILENAHRVMKRKASKVEWLRRVFGPQAEAVVLGALPRYTKGEKEGELKKKSWVCPYGTVKFSARQAKLEVENEDMALAFADENNLTDCIQIKRKFMISGLPDKDKDALIQSPTNAGMVGFTVLPSRLSPTITTGIKANASKSDN